ncbi:MAG: efflux RND transporter permease subunit [Pyrinomonadaceae bacterium]
MRSRRALALQVQCLPSVSLTESVRNTSKVEEVLKSFPEVTKVISKTGPAGVSTDPMSIDFSDLYVELKPHDEWTTAGTKAELVEKMSAKLERRAPGTAISFSQPIELRVAELISGVRSDISIKLFGDDLDILSETADKIAAAVRKVKGAEDVKAEATSGLPQLQIKVDRAAVARYGLNVEDVNDLVELNVRGRDIGSFVGEAQAVIARDVQIPPGYYLTWGGTFENLQRASERLAVVVPLALFLIFVLLFSTFNSVKQAILIYTGIPFAIVGGIFALFLRGMPFSISAGVGFIALFGVAVLNGVVMVSYINHLREEGQRVADAVRLGAMTRLRPVLMTALVASLGFIPMAIGSGAGAEVQRPLATVVIGGLVTSTLLTLYLLPTLYAWFEKEIGEKAHDACQTERGHGSSQGNRPTAAGQNKRRLAIVWRRW